MSYEVIRGNALDLPLEDESVDLIVTSPPYFALRSYRDEGGKPNIDHPLGKLPGSVWTIPSEPLIVPEALGLPDHFAAFPQEWPRRIILGWSPNGVCTACGEGRRPVVEKRLRFVRPPQNRKADWSNLHRSDGANSKSQSIGQPGENEATITGHACACPDDSAPTTPSVCLDPFGGTGTVAGVAHALGRHGISVDLSADYCRLAEWRIGQSGHFQKAWERTAAAGGSVALTSPKDEAEGKLSLFGEAS